MHVVHVGLHSDAVSMDYQESISYSNCFIFDFQIHAIDYFWISTVFLMAVMILQ